MTDLHVRAAEPHDLADAALVRALGWQAAYAGAVDAAELAGLTEPDALRAWADRAAELADGPEGTAYLVADLDSRVIGFAALGAERGSGPGALRGELYALYVLPDHWRSGAGSALLHATLDELAARGYDRVTLWVLDGNDRAIAFYERHGFRLTGEVQRDHRGLDDLRMARPLEPRPDVEHRDG